MEPEMCKPLRGDTMSPLAPVGISYLVFLFRITKAISTAP